MLIKASEGLIPVGHGGPDKQFVVIAPGGNLIFIMHTPFKAADLLFVTEELILIRF